MASMDIFNADAFTLQSLTAKIAETPFVPGRLGAMGIFQNEGVNTTSISIEKDGATLALVPNASRGGVGSVVTNDKRSLVPFNTLHLPQMGAVMADEVQNVRAFGSESEEDAVLAMVTRQLAKHRRQIDATLEHLMIGAVKGEIKDADGTTTLIDTFTTFGVTQSTKAMALDTGTTKVRTKVLELLDQIEDELGGIGFAGVRVLCGRTFFKALVDHDKVTANFELGSDELTNDVRGAFEFGGVVFEQYRGSIGANKFIADNEAYAIPMGVPDLFIGRFAPANYIETVGTNGLPYYSKMEAMSMGKGMALESQSNPLFLCTRPNAVVKLTQV